MKERHVIGFVCAYELAAFASNGRIPTWTSLVMRLPQPARAALISSVTYWMVNHFQVRRKT